MNKSFFYRFIVLSLGAMLAGIVACQNPATPDNVNPSNPVHPQTDQEKVEAAKATLELRVNGKVGNRINLPRRGAHEVEISWSASPSGIIETEEQNSGKVNRPDDDTAVTLTATLTRGSATATKPFTVTVYGKNQELVDQAVRNIGPQPPAFVMGSGMPQTIDLQKTYGSDPDKVEFTWTAAPEGSITFGSHPHSPSQLIIGTVMQHETEKQEVSLTATAQKGNSTATGTFKITVYPKNVEPSLTDLLTQIMATIPAETDKDIPLIVTVASGYTHTLTWTSSDNEVLDSSYEKARVTRDLVDRKVTLKAELKKMYGSSTPETMEKEITVKAQTKFSNCELAGDLLTIKDGAGTATAVYRVQINADAKTIAAAAKQVAVEGTLMTLDAAKLQMLANLDLNLQYYRSLLSLCDKQTVTLQDVKKAVTQIEPDAATMSDEAVFRYLFGKDESYEDFAALGAEAQTQFLKENHLNPIKEGLYGYLAIPPETPLEQALAQLKEKDIADISARVENAKKPRTYTYRVDSYNNRLVMEALYVTGIPWYQQDGYYEWLDWDSANIQSVSLSLSKQGNGKYWVSISIRKAGEPSVDFNASGYDGSGTITARTNDSKQITVTVSERDSGKVDVTSTGEVSFTKELEFEGKSIPDDPLRN